MKVEVREKENCDGYLMQQLWINGKREVKVYPLAECPEDAIIGRSLVSCDEIAELMQRAHAAGAEPFELTTAQME